MAQLQPIIDSPEQVNGGVDAAPLDIEPQIPVAAGLLVVGETIGVEQVGVPELESVPEDIPSGAARPRLNRKRTETTQGVVDTDDLLDLYMKEARQFPLLKKDDEVKLAQAREEGLAAQAKLAENPELDEEQAADLKRQIREGKDAERKFICSNLKLVVRNARRYLGKSDLSMLDLIQEGNIGLMKAVESFDWRKDFKFSTHATRPIRQAMSRAGHNTGRMIRIPVHMHERRRAVAKAQADTVGAGSERAGIEELADKSDLSPKQVMEALSSFGRTEVRSLDYESNIVSFKGDTVTPSDKTVDVESEAAFRDKESAIARRESLLKLIDDAKLSDKEKDVLVLRFGLDGREPLTLNEAGKHSNFGLTRERIRQIEVKAIEKLRKAAQNTDASDAL